MSQELQQTRYDQIMRRVGGLIGPGSKVSEVLGELFPVVDVERIPGELLRLGGTFLGFGGASVTGAAGQSGRLQLFNPVGSGKIITVSHVDLGTQVTDVIRFGVTTTALTTGVGTEVHRDLRSLPPLRPTGQIRTLSSVALAPATGQVRLLSNTSYRLSDDNSLAVLLPGSGFEVGNTAVAITVTAVFFWRERVLEASEINL